MDSIQTATTGILSITGGTFTATNGTGAGANAGLIQIGNNTTFATGGPLNNTGAITLNSIGNSTRLLFTAANVLLSGGGQIILGDSTQNVVTASLAADVLTNVNNTISGGGQLGSGQLTLVNQAAGVINANVSNALVLNTGAATVQNSGLIEATGSGGLTIAGTTVNDSTGGTIKASGGTVRLQTAHIIGGVLNNSGGAVITSTDGGSVIDGSTSTVNNQGRLQVANNTALTLQGAINNTGVIAMVSAGNGTNLVIGASNVTLSGGGQVTLSDNSQNYIFGVTAAATLTNVNNTISGSGQLGNGQLTLINQASGVINANNPGNALYLNTAGKTVSNAGLIEATGAAGLTIVSTTVDDSGGGTILASNAVVRLQSADIIGGTLKTVGSGVITTTDAGSVLDSLTAPVTSTGALTIANNTALTALGTLTNTGVLSLASIGNGTYLIVSANNLTISGAGQVLLSDNSQNYVVGTLSGPAGSQVVSTLTLNSLLSGAGQIGSNLKLVNNSTIDATTTNVLLLSTGASGVAGSNIVTNKGVLESTNPNALGGLGGLLIRNTVIDNNGTLGAVTASGAHTHVDLQTATIIGGTLIAQNGGVIDTVDGGNLLDGAANAVKIQGGLTVNNNTAIHVRGTINNTGFIDLNSLGNGTFLFVDTGDVSLTGGGIVALTDNSQNYIVGAATTTTLTNVDNTISGAGQLGNGQLTLINQAGGVINASAASNALVINTGAQTVVNHGLIEATGAAGLNLNGVTLDDSAGGVLLASGSTVRLASVHIIGGPLNATAGGQFLTTDSGTVFDGSASTVTIQGLINVQNNTALHLRGAIKNTSTIALGSLGNGTDLIIDAGGATLSGGGHVTLSDNTQNYIFGATGATTLTNVDNVITGSGQLGNGQLTLINQAAGVINASGVNNALVISTGAAPVVNHGLIEATAAAGLNINSTTIDDSVGGVLLSSASTIRLATAHLIGGTLTASSGGLYVTTDAGSVLDGSNFAVNLQAPINIQNNTALHISGAIHNTGSINLGSLGNGTDLIADANATLDGGGRITLSDNTQNYIFGAAGATSLTNVDNIITGAGQLGNGQLTLINQTKGVINGNAASNTLTINTGAAPVVNHGLIEATAGGGITIFNTTVNNGVDGVILSSGSTIRLQSATIAGGTLQSALGGVFVTADGGSVLDGLANAVKTSAQINIANNQALHLQGAVVNSGTIALGSGGNGTFLTVNAAGATLSGGGRITLSDNSQNYIFGSTGAATLTNVDNLISGAGQFGNGQLTLVNQAAGVINGVGSNSLTLNTAANTITNAGLIEATGPGGVIIQSAVANSGVLEANGGVLTINGAVTGAGVATVVSGLIVFTSTYSGALNFSGATGTIELDHALSYTGTVTGFSTHGGGSFDTLDLRDVGFVGAGEASFAGGVLTVTDGTHTAHIAMAGNYAATTFQAASDGRGGVNVTILATAPVAGADSYPTATGQTLTVSAASGVLANDADPNGLPLTATLAVGGAPAHGTLTLNANGSFSYTPTAGFTGSDSFKYVAVDAQGSSAPATVTLTVGSTIPTLRPDSYGVATGQTLTVNAAAGVLANDTDPNGQTLIAAVATGAGPQHGSLSLNANGSFTYTPTAGFAGTDTFNYIAHDSVASGPPTAVTITVGAALPNSTPDTYSVTAGQTLSAPQATGVLANDTDPNGLTLTAALAPGGGVLHGVLSLNANGAFTYTPTAGFVGQDHFTYIASDGVASGALTLVTLNVAGGAPTGQPDSYSGAAGQSLTVSAASGVLANDTDPNGLTLTAALAAGGGPAHGSLTLNANGAFTYTPNAGFAGADSFTYIASDSAASSAPTTVSLTISSSPPTSVSDSYSAAANQTLTVTAATGVLANDTDPNGLPLTAALAAGGGPTHGALTLNANGSFTYTPTAGYTGPDSFKYIASDSLRSGPATTVSLTVASNTPVTRADSYSDGAGQTLTVAAVAGVLANDTDPGGRTLTASLAAGGGPAHGALTLNADGSFTYHPNAGFAGPDSFSYIASNGLSSSAATAVTVNVTATAPTAVADAYTALPSQTLSITAAAGVLANDTDANGLALAATLASGGGPSHGSLTLNADGSFAYTPVAGFHGQDSFRYVPSDSLSSGAATTVTVTVTAGNPVSGADSYTAHPGQTLTVAAAAGVLVNDTDPNGLALTAALAAGGGPSHGALSLNTDGSFTYTATNGFVGNDAFTYVASDGVGSGPGTVVTLHVTAITPTANPDAYSLTAGHALTVAAAQGVLANDTDPNGLSLTAALAQGGGPAHGSLSLSANGAFVYTPNAGFSGADGFSYVASDSAGTSAATHVSLNVTTSAPRLLADAYTILPGQALSVSAANGVLANDTDANGLPLTATLSATGLPTHGKVVLNSDGSFVYTPTPHLGGPFVGVDSFTYIAKDAASAGVAVTVNIFSGAGHAVTLFDAAVDTFTGAAGGNVYVLTKGMIEDPTTHGGLIDTITNFSGAGSATATDGDYLMLRGFTSAATLAYEHDLPNDPHAHVYLITDGAYHAEIVLDYLGTGVNLNHHEYGFF